MKEDYNHKMLQSLRDEVDNLYYSVRSYRDDDKIGSSLSVAKYARNVANIAREIAGHNISVCRSTESGPTPIVKTLDIIDASCDKVHSISTDDSAYVYEIVEHMPGIMNIPYLSYRVKDEMGNIMIVSKAEFMNTVDKDIPTLRSIVDGIILGICEKYKDEVIESN